MLVGKQKKISDSYLVDWYQHLVNRLRSDSHRYQAPFRDNQEVHNKSIQIKHNQIQSQYQSKQFIWHFKLL